MHCLSASKLFTNYHVLHVNLLSVYETSYTGIATTAFYSHLIYLQYIHYIHTVLHLPLKMLLKLLHFSEVRCNGSHVDIHFLAIGTVSSYASVYSFRLSGLI
jgi:hypothetical protein